MKQYMLSLNHDDRVIAEETLVAYKKHLFTEIIDIIADIDEEDLKELRSGKTNLGKTLPLAIKVACSLNNRDVL